MYIILLKEFYTEPKFRISQTLKITFIILMCKLQVRVTTVTGFRLTSHDTV